MKLHIIYGTAIVGALLVGKYVLQEKPEIKEVVRTVYVEKKVEKKDVITKVVEVKKPDGTITTETTISDKTVVNSESKLDVKKELKASTGAKLTLGLLAVKNADNFSQKFEYAATITAPFIGNLKLQALGTTDKRVGLGLALEF